MIEDQKARGLEIQHKLLLDVHGKPVIIRTLENVMATGVEESVVVLGHFNGEIEAVISEWSGDNVKIAINPDVNVELSDTLLNGIKNIEPGLCLCVAADQPTVSTQTLKNLIKTAAAWPETENIVSILARGNTGHLKTTKGLGMPFVCHSELLKKYLPGKADNLNPILGNMIADGVAFFGVASCAPLELVNINHWDDYLRVLKELN